MNQSRSDRSVVASVDIILLACLYAGQFGLALLLLGLYKKGDDPLTYFLTTTTGLLSAGAFALIALALLLIVWRYLTTRREQSRAFGLTLAMNIISVVIIVVAGELAIRALTKENLEGTPLLNDGILLLPRNWHTVSLRYRNFIEKRGEDGAFIHDPKVGWSMRPNHSDKHRMHTTSAEGLRSGDPNVVYGDRNPGRRIALVGDSFTYAEDVSYDNSWGYRLEQKLGPDVQVLNFGVSGYGVDQAYLRYEHAVKPWRPDVVIFGVFPDDIERAMVVYPFIRRPQWGNPYSKPRLVAGGADLVVINAPALAPEEIFSAPTIAALPHLDYDRGYNAFQWTHRWQHASFLVRFLISRFPRWDAPDPVNNDAAMESLALQIFRTFSDSVTRAGSQAVFAYLPSRQDVDEHEAGTAPSSTAKRILLRGGIEHIDLTSCVAQVPREERYMLSGTGHFTPVANDAVAECLAAKIPI